MNFKEYFKICEQTDLSEVRKFAPLKHLFAKDDLKMYHRELTGVMPAGKVTHSVNVASRVARAGGDLDAVKAAMFHDFLERGGDVHTAAIKLGLSPRVIRIIDALSSEEKSEGESSENGPLEHIRSVLMKPQMPPDLRNIIILIKLADRIDNLNRRLAKGAIGEGYLQKSRDLAGFLFSQYHGDPGEIMMLRNKLKQLGVKIKKRMIGNYRDVA